MAQSKLELAVGTGQWDAGLKKAQQALNSFTQAQGGLQQALQKDNGDMQKFIQMLGKMDSTAATTKGQMNDYKRVLEQLTADYNKMSDAQKKSIGTDYLQTIDALKEKFKAAKQQVDEFNRSLGNTSEIKLPEGGSGLFGGGKLDGMLQVFGGNLMTKAAGFAAEFASEIAGCVSQGIELARQGEGVRRAFERLGRGDILDGLREATHGTVTDIELMKAAVKFNDFKLPVEELGTMLAFAQQKAKDTGQSVDYMVDSIVTGLGRKSLMILDNLGLSAAEIKDKMKDTGDMTKAVGAIIREQMAKAGDYVETAADRAAQANVNMQNKMEELGRKFAPLQEASNSLWTSMKIGILDVIGGPLTDLLNKLTEAGRLKNALNNINGDGTKGSTVVANQLKQLQAAKKSGASQYMLNTMQSGVIEGYNRQINEREQAIKDWNAWRRGSRSEGLQERIGQWRDKYGTDVNSIKAEADAYRAMIAEYRKGAKDIMTPVTVDVKTDNAVKSLDELKVKLADLQTQRKKVVAGSDEAKRLDTEIRQVKADIKLQDPSAFNTGKSKQQQAEDKVAAALLDYQQTIDKASLELKSGAATEADVKKKQLSAQERLYDAYGDAYALYKDTKYKDAQDKAAEEIVKLGGEVKAATEAQEAARKAARELESAQKKLADAQTELANAQASGDLKQIYAAEKKVETAQTNLTNVQSGGTASPVVVPVSLTTGNLEAFTSHIKEELAKADLGSSAALSLQEGLSDATAIGTILQTAIQNGIDTAQFDTSGLMQKLMNHEDISDDVIQQYVDELNAKLMEKFDETEWPNVLITFDADTKNIVNAAKQQEKDAQKMAKNWQAAGSAIQAVGAAMNQIEDPAAKVLGTIAQAVATMALSYSQAAASPAVTSTGWGWIAFAATGVATMLSSIAAIKNATSGFASGGVIPGNSYSGDNMRGITPDGNVYGLNAGEVVLNRAQQGNLAAQLERSNAGSGVESQPFITGELLYLGMNNYLRRSGRGEIVTSR